jgi:addiction module RelE/StbE family toxin
MKLVYSARSLRHLRSIHAYIAQDNPAAADRVVERIRDATSRLVNFPYSGRPGPKGTRLLSVPGAPYIVVHRVRGNEVTVLTILHTARNRSF